MPNQNIEMDEKYLDQVLEAPVGKIPPRPVAAPRSIEEAAEAIQAARPKRPIGGFDPTKT